ncbi:MAG: hypothetical protein RR412_09105 [Burkholderiaceae bacterium]
MLTLFGAQAALWRAAARIFPIMTPVLLMPFEKTVAHLLAFLRAHSLAHCGTLLGRHPAPGAFALVHVRSAAAAHVAPRARLGRLPARTTALAHRLRGDSEGKKR